MQQVSIPKIKFKGKYKRKILVLKKLIRYDKDIFTMISRQGLFASVGAAPMAGGRKENPQKF